MKTKTKTKSYRTMKMEKKKKKKRKRNLNIVEHSIWGKKKERTDIFSKIDSTSLHRLKKRRKEN